MGKKEKFIDKNNSQKFHVLHRSQRDEAHANFEVPSNFVLVPAVDNGNNNSNNNGGGGRYKATKPVKLAANKDHINELGFANDGYDYSQHLRDLGSGGHFISKTGRAGTDLDMSVLTRSQGAMVELPEDCMPSAKNLDRHYEAITINHNLMDKDIRAALFDGFDDEGEFEELQDDFITQVMNEPADDDFDFDAHIAKLIARSEQTLGLGPVPGFKSKVKFAGEDGEEELRSSGDEGEEDSDDEFPDFLLDDMDPEAMAAYQKAQQAGKKSNRKSRGRRASEDSYSESEDGTGAHFVAGGAKDAAVGPISAEAREALELQFERTLLDYDSDEMGYMDHLDEEDEAFGGEIALDDAGAFEAALDEFLLEKKDNLFIEGTGLRKGVRASVKDPKKTEEELELENLPVDLKALALEQNTLQAATEAELVRMKNAPKDTGIETCQAYLQEVREEEEWDCESILSTYSTLDNHPTLIKDTNTKFRKYKSPHQRALDAEAAAQSGMSSAGSVMSRGSYMSRGSRAQKSVISKGPSIIYGTPAALSAANAKSGVNGTAPGKIVLGGRLNLPEGFGPSTFEKRKEVHQRSLDDSTHEVQSGMTKTPSTVVGAVTKTANKGRRSKNKAVVAVGGLEKVTEGNSESETESNSDDEDEEEDGEEGEEGEFSDSSSYLARQQAKAQIRKRRQETPEEKKARKEAVKEERRGKRQGKKELKNAFKEEGSKIIRSVGQEQSIDHVSVFRY